MKTCFKCGLEKPIVSFYKHPDMADGHLNKCKECTKADARGRPSVKEYDRLRGRLPHRLEKARQVGKLWRQANPDKANAWRLRNPEKYKAHTALGNAIRAGKLTRQPCHICGGLGEAHHHDYARPLEVRWLCRAHHAAEHRRF